jgi:hypothetical protein
MAAVSVAGAARQPVAPPGQQSAAVNQLGAQRSAYLQQHARNPVHWRPWSQGAFADAAARYAVLFVSSGYSSCHWCVRSRAWMWMLRDLRAQLPSLQLLTP